MTMADVYCRFNRARGMEVWSVGNAVCDMLNCINTVGVTR